MIYSKVERLCADPKRRSCLSMCWYIPKEPKKSEKKKRLNQRECGKNRWALTVFSQRKEKKKKTIMNSNKYKYRRVLALLCSCWICMRQRRRRWYVGDIMYTIARLSVRSSHLCQAEFEKKNLKKNCVSNVELGKIHVVIDGQCDD